MQGLAGCSWRSPLCFGGAPSHNICSTNPPLPYPSLRADVIKVRQQTSGYNNRNFLATGFNVVRHEGVLSLYRGCTAAVARGVLYGGALSA